MKNVDIPIVESRDKTREQICSTPQPPVTVSLNERLGNIDRETAQQTISLTTSTGKPLYTVEDLYRTRDTLGLMLRYLIIRDDITKEKFEQRHDDLAKQANIHSNKRHYDRHNIYTSLKSPNATWLFLEKFCQYCGYDILDVQITLYDRYSREVSTLKKSDVIKLIDAPHESISIEENERRAREYQDDSE